MVDGAKASRYGRSKGVLRRRREDADRLVRGEEVVLMKDASGRVLGFEKLNFSIPQSDSMHVDLETVPA